MPIVTSTYRYKRPPRKRKPQTAEAPAVVTIDPKTRVAKEGRRETSPDEKAAAKVMGRNPPGDDQAGERHGLPNSATWSTMYAAHPSHTARKSAIVTIRSAGEDMTPEEHKRRGDAADALFREMKRRIAAGLK
jgi:hypothetical protein